MKLRTIGVAVLLALSLTACGQDEEAASQAISDSIMESNDQTFEVTQEEADCVGDGMVEEIGVDQLTEYGIITEDLEANDGIENVKMSEGDAGSAADVMAGCADIKELFTSAMGELPEEAQQCVEENLSDEVLHNFLTAVFMNDQEAGNQELMGALQECLGPQG
ncbi:fimbrillin family protein [Nocardioides sp. GXQ0305]|uniref:fimbrillin family protein n=1 Tax=Nocardioides sp. GXQ0305 TaxID=3423912 RepID=UPI003D7E7939